MFTLIRPSQISSTFTSLIGDTSDAVVCIVSVLFRVSNSFNIFIKFPNPWIIMMPTLIFIFCWVAGQNLDIFPIFHFLSFSTLVQHWKYILSILFFIFFFYFFFHFSIFWIYFFFSFAVLLFCFFLFIYFLFLFFFFFIFYSVF